MDQLKSLKINNENIKEIIKSINPKDINNTIDIFSLINFRIREKFLQLYDNPLDEIFDKDQDKYFIKSPYNQEINNFRSPWSNKYYPETNEKNYFPNEKIRNEEIRANNIWEKYVKQYYGTATSSVYYWNLNNVLPYISFLVHKSIFIMIY